MRLRPLILIAMATGLWLVAPPTLSSAASSSEPKAQGGRLTVVELFTSQGCSSCPPADRYIGRLARRKDVIALSFHVNYWDYIGWSDPFASTETTRRQRDYRRSLGSRFVYTPQLVVNGRNHSASLARVDALIADSATRPSLPVSFIGDAQNHRVKIGAGPVQGTAAIWLIFYDKKHVTDVPRGENRGREIRDYNVVREITRIGTWSGKAIEIPISLIEAKRDGRGGCVVFVQQGRTGPILGAALLML